MRCIALFAIATFLPGGDGTFLLERNVTQCIKYFINNFLHNSKLLLINSLNDSVDNIKIGRKLILPNMFWSNTAVNYHIEIIKDISQHSSIWIMNAKSAEKFFSKASCSTETVILLSENYNSFSDTLTKIFDQPCSNTSVLMFAVVSSKIKSVVEVLWRKSVANCVLLDTKSFNLYTWFPLSKSKYSRCTDKPEPELIGQWIPHNQTLANQTSIFPGNKINKMNNCSINANIYEWPPYVLASGLNASLEELKIIDESKLDGVDIRLFNIFSEKMNLRVNYTFKSLNTMIQTLVPNLRDHVTDVGFSGLPLFWAKQQKGLGITSVYVSEDSTWYVPIVLPYQIGGKIFRVLSIQFWMLILVSYICMVLILKVSSRGIEKFHSLIVLATMLGMSSLYKPTRSISRLTYMIFTYCCFEIYISYQSSLMSHLVSPHFQPAINNFNDLLMSKLRIATNNVTIFFLEPYMSTKKYQLFKEKSDAIEDFEEIFKNIVFEKKYATICTETCVKKYFPPNVSISENIRRIDEKFWKVDIVMVAQKGSPLLNLINRHLELCFQSGITMKIWNDISKRIDKAEIHKDVLPLNVNQLKDVFVAFCIGLCCTCLIFISEILFYNFFQNWLSRVLC